MVLRSRLGGNLRVHCADPDGVIGYQRPRGLLSNTLAPFPGLVPSYRYQLHDIIRRNISGTYYNIQAHLPGRLEHVSSGQRG